MMGLAKGPKSSVMHFKVGGKAATGSKVGRGFIPSQPSKAPNPFKQARTLVTRATGSHKLGRPY